MLFVAFVLVPLVRMAEHAEKATIQITKGIVARDDELFISPS